MRHPRTRLCAAIALAVALACAAPAVLAADSGDPDSGDSWQKVFEYAACAVAVAGAPSGVMMAIAVVTCGKILCQELAI